MSLPVMDGHDDEPDDKPHPENPKRCRPCDNADHDNCRIKYAGGTKCKCECRNPARTKKHDWLDERFNDEIDLEKSISEVPPYALVTKAMYAGTVLNTAKDSAWYFLGKFEATSRRPSTTDARWTLTCKRCDDAHKIKTTRFHLEETHATDIRWLKERSITVPAQPERTYRVGRCKTCGAIFWFEMKVKK